MLDLEITRAVGAKVTVIVHEPVKGATVAPVQVSFVLLNGLAGAETVEIASFAVPVFLTVITTRLVPPNTTPPKAFEVGDTEIIGATGGTFPLPVRVMVVVGLTGSLEIIPNESCLKPASVGMKSNVTVHLPAGSQSLDAIAPGNDKLRCGGIYQSGNNQGSSPLVCYCDGLL